MPKSLHPNRLGRELRRMREIAGLTKAELAARAALSVQTIGRLESGLGNLGSWRQAIDALSPYLPGRVLQPGVPLGMALAELRRRKGLTQKQLSSMVKVSKRALIAFERRDQGRLSTLERVNAALDARLYLTFEARDSHVLSQPRADG